ncbi:homocysteine S-methyltransferase YbgG-like [Neocloeon triangulifer]|uniref:homocysteine S-methyltransferase YbgG-like n=1 Tax=Neocloeon triangulifer TaxID=2078957 RepID=UPI00286F390E|nr:homocysteine S-methyltransferase YbgG-like [Neocloeon triangulifer]XP_059489901.1 homocysteine S-methyltransferase YbgG-like [Neocloeon triangulifer]
MKPIVIDGGFGTQMATYLGSSSVDADPLWSARALATNPDLIVQIHLDFLKAGAELIRTNSYQASVGGFVEHLGLSEVQSLELIKKSVRLAETAVEKYKTADDTKALQDLHIPILGSVGPYGACLHDGSEYFGYEGKGLTREQLIDWHRPRISALAEAGVQVLAVETIPSQLEAAAISYLIKTEFPQLRFWVSFSCKDDQRISEGTLIKDAAAECWQIASSQLEAIGVNCVHPAYVSSLLKSIKEANSSVPLVAYPNSGEQYIAGQGWHADGVKVSQFVQEWLPLGTRFVGGCCRTYPRDIEEILSRVRRISAAADP